MLRTESISFSYQSNTLFKFPDIKCQQGETLIITGESGSGKTTLLHLLGGISKPNSGNVFIENQAISQLDGSSLDAYRGNHISIIFQKMHFIASLSVLDNILVAQWLGNQKKSKEKAISLLRQLNIEDQKNKKPSQLSIGQQQRLAIARAVINEPKVILADEPTSSLDDKNAQIVAELLITSAAEFNAALIVVTHDQRIKHLANQIIELR